MPILAAACLAVSEEIGNRKKTELYTPCPEKNGTNKVLGITLANTNI